MQWYSDSRRSLVRFWTHNRHPIPHLAGEGSNVSMTDEHAAFTSIPIGPSRPEDYQNSKCSVSNTYLNACFWRVGWCLYTMGLLPDTQKMRVAHTLELPGTVSPPPRVSVPDMHPGTCVTHMPWCMPRLWINGFFWSRWREKRSWHSRRMRIPQFCVFGKRPMRPLISTSSGRCSHYADPEALNIRGHR